MFHDITIVGSKYTNLTAVPTTLGGIEAGTTFSNVPIEDVITNLLYPFKYPAFTSFSISGLSTTTYELGYTFPANNYTFTWATSNISNIKPDSITLNGVASLSNDGSEIQAVTEITKIAVATHTFSIVGVNIKETTFARNLTLSWKPMIFYGENVIVTIDEVTAKTLRVQNLATSFVGSYSFNTGGYKYILFPKSFGTPTNFKDPSTNLDVAMEEIVQELSITNDFGVTLDYYAYRTKNVLGGAITINVS